MIYCFKRLKELKLLHIFFMHYGISLAVGSTIIAGLFLLGGGLQMFSIMVILNMYNQPAIIMLRRMEVYEIRSELSDDSLSLSEKLAIAIESTFVKPTPDLIFLNNAVIIGGSAAVFFAVNDFLLACITEFPALTVWSSYILVVGFSFILGFIEYEIIQSLKNETR